MLVTQIFVLVTLLRMLVPDAYKKGVGSKKIKNLIINDQNCIKHPKLVTEIFSS